MKQVQSADKARPAQLSHAAVAVGHTMKLVVEVLLSKPALVRAFYSFPAVSAWLEALLLRSPPALAEPVRLGIQRLCIMWHGEPGAHPLHFFVQRLWRTYRQILNSQLGILVLQFDKLVRTKKTVDPRV